MFGNSSKARLVRNPSKAWIKWLLDVSRGFEDAAERCGDEVDHGDEGTGVSVAACPGASGLEDTVERLHASIAVG